SFGIAPQFIAVELPSWAFAGQREHLGDGFRSIASAQARHQVPHRLLKRSVLGIKRLTFHNRFFVEAVLNESGKRSKSASAISRPIPRGCEISQSICGDFLDGLVSTIRGFGQSVADSLVAMDGGETAILAIDAFEQRSHIEGITGKTFGTTNVIVIGGGLDWFLSPTMYIPVSLEYGMLPKSDEVDAKWIAVRAGLAVPF
nr:hypothetical protein [Bdellovibrionales bacterium]